MTRTEFVKHWAKFTSVSDTWAELGLVDMGRQTHIALPCACDEDPRCMGWRMLSVDAVDDHLRTHAPGPLRRAYIDATR